ncbi:MAG: HDIG domain-containing metalloprotein [Candidatus Methanoperedens sp.]
MNKSDAIAFLEKSGCSPDVIDHCMAVAIYARELAACIIECSEKKGTRVEIDIDAVYIGALLHDIGRSKTHGLRHAVEGAEMAIGMGLDYKIVNIIERHIGGGIPGEEAVVIGLPEKDYIPVSIEEKLVAHADNLFSGSQLCTMEDTVSRLRRKKLDENIVRRIIDLGNEISLMQC